MNECRNCKEKFKPVRSSSGYYCSKACHCEFEYKKNVADWLAGNRKGYKGKTLQVTQFVRRYLLELNNYSCVECGWNKRHPVDNLPLVEIDHIDGDASNCTIDNLRVLCPNCHSMTPTFRRRNGFSKRDRKPD